MSETLFGTVLTSGTDLDALSKQIDESGSRIPGHIPNDTPIPPPPGFEDKAKPTLDINPAFAGALNVHKEEPVDENAELIAQAKAAEQEGYLSPEETADFMQKAEERIAAMEEPVSEEDVTAIIGEETPVETMEVTSPIIEPIGEIDLVTGGSVSPESQPVEELPVNVVDTEGSTTTLMGEKLAEALNGTHQFFSVNQADESSFTTADTVQEMHVTSMAPIEEPKSVPNDPTMVYIPDSVSTEELTAGKLEYSKPEILAESDEKANLLTCASGIGSRFTPLDEAVPCHFEGSETASEQPAEEAVPEKPFEPIVPVLSTKAPFIKRVDAKHLPNKGVQQEKDIFNRTLVFVLKEFFKTTAVDEEIRIQGTFVKNSKTEGIWDEGGATSTNGHVVTATDPEGKPLIPVFVYQSKGVVNGRHALVQVWPKCYIIFGGHRYGKAILGVYRIEDIAPVTNENQKYPKFLCQLVAVMTERTWKPVDPSETKWTREHPAVKAAYDRIFEINASTPAYVANYREQHFDPEDFGSCIKDTEFLECLESFDSLGDMYDYIGSELGYHIGTGLAKNQQPLAITSLNYFKEQNIVAVFVFGVLYDSNTRSSQDNRIAYARVLLKPGDSFYYIDKDESASISFEDLSNVLTRNGGAMATSFRRMTEYK